MFEVGKYAIHDPAKLVALWDVDENLSLNLFRLACPKNWESIWRSPESHWNVEVPHPATWTEPADDFRGESKPDFGLDLDSAGSGDDDEPKD